MQRTISREMYVGRLSYPEASGYKQYDSPSIKILNRKPRASEFKIHFGVCDFARRTMISSHLSRCSVKWRIMLKFTMFDKSGFNE